MRPIAIDPAPVGLHFCDGTGRPTLSPLPQLGELLDGGDDAVVIGWDGPLTGPAEAEGARLAPADLVRRVIEAFFKSTPHGFSLPAGIPYVGWSGSPHWPLTRRIFGLPRVGPWDQPLEALPYRLATSGDAPTSGRWIVETNAAVAIWLCVRDHPAGKMVVWAHKDRPDVRAQIWNIVAQRLTGRPAEELADFWKMPSPDNAEQMDSLTTWLLVSRWIAGDPGVTILGSARTGAWLLPATDGMADAFNSFAEVELERRRV
jgi:hypothetical protein